MDKKIKILHFEDSIKDSELIHSLIESGGIEHDYFWADNEKDYTRILKNENIDLILSDYSLPGYNGNRALIAARENYSDIPFIFVSGSMGEDVAINSLLNGATDYVLKNKLERLVPAIKRVMHEYEIASKRKQAEVAFSASETRYRRLFESAKDGILILDAETGKILDMNPFLIELLGYSKENFLEKKIWEIGFFKDIIANQDKFLELQKQKYVRYDDLPLETINGKKINVEFVSNVYLENNRKIIQCNIRDITTRRLLERALWKSEIEFRQLAESMPQIVWITKPDGMNIYFNQQWCNYTGLTLAESYGHGWNTPFHPDDQLKAWDAWQNATRKNGIYSIESRLRRADGEYRWWLVRGIPIMDEQGIILKWFGTCTDIQEFKLGEIALRESEISLKNAQEIAKIGNWETYLSNLSVIWSAELYNIFEIDKDVFVPSHPAFLSFVHPDDRTFVDDAFATSFEKHSSSIIDHRIITHSGVVKFIEERWQIVSDDNGKPIKAVGTCQDITERKLAEIELQESEERFRRVIQATEDGIWEWNIQTNQEFFSPRWCEIIGYSFDDPELIHSFKTWTERIHTDDYDRVIGALNNHLEKGVKYDVDYQHLHRSGEYRWQNSKGKAIFDKNGKPTKMVGCISDITISKQAEMEIKKNVEELQQFHRLSVGREMRIIELKQQINDIQKQHGEPVKYNLDFLTGNIDNDK